MVAWVIWLLLNHITVWSHVLCPHVNGPSVSCRSTWNTNIIPTLCKRIDAQSSQWKRTRHDLSNFSETEKKQKAKWFEWYNRSRLERQRSHVSAVTEIMENQEQNNGAFIQRSFELTNITSTSNYSQGWTQIDTICKTKRGNTFI